MHVLTPPARLIALLLAIVLAASACSSGSDDATPETAAAEPAASANEGSTGEPAGRDANGVSLDPDCAAAEKANGVIRSNNGWIANITDEADTLDIDGQPRSLQPMIDAVAALRPFQDIETESFGTMRSALDNIQSNLDAAAEGRYGDLEDVPVVVVIGSTVSVICG